MSVSVTVAIVSVIVGHVSVDGSNVRVEVGNMRAKVANVSVIVGDLSVNVGNVSVDIGYVCVNGGNVGVEVRYVSVVFASWRSPTAEFCPSSASYAASTDDCFAQCSYVVPPPANMDAVTVKRNWRCASRGQRGGRAG